jgi:hypothetical protein
MYERELTEEFASLGPEEQKRVLGYARSLNRHAEPPANWRENLLALGGTVPKDVLEEMRKAVEDCERVDLDD